MALVTLIAIMWLEEAWVDLHVEMNIAAVLGSETLQIFIVLSAAAILFMGLLLSGVLLHAIINVYPGELQGRTAAVVFTDLLDIGTRAARGATEDGHEHGAKLKGVDRRSHGADIPEPGHAVQGSWQPGNLEASGA